MALCVDSPLSFIHPIFGPFASVRHFETWMNFGQVNECRTLSLRDLETWRDSNRHRQQRTEEHYLRVAHAIYLRAMQYEGMQLDIIESVLPFSMYAPQTSHSPRCYTGNAIFLLDYYEDIRDALVKNTIPAFVSRAEDFYRSLNYRPLNEAKEASGPSVGLGDVLDRYSPRQVEIAQSAEQKPEKKKVESKKTEKPEKEKVKKEKPVKVKVEEKIVAGFSARILARALASAVYTNFSSWFEKLGQTFSINAETKRLTGQFTELADEINALLASADIARQAIDVADVSVRVFFEKPQEDVEKYLVGMLRVVGSSLEFCIFDNGHHEDDQGHDRQLVALAVTYKYRNDNRLCCGSNLSFVDAYWVGEKTVPMFTQPAHVDEGKGVRWDLGFDYYTQRLVIDPRTMTVSLEGIPEDERKRPSKSKAEAEPQSLLDGVGMEPSVESANA